MVLRQAKRLTSVNIFTQVGMHVLLSCRPYMLIWGSDIEENGYYQAEYDLDQGYLSHLFVTQTVRPVSSILRTKRYGCRDNPQHHCYCV